MTRIEQGQAALSPAEMDLGALVRDVAQHFEFDLARASCRLSVNCLDPVVEGSTFTVRLPRTLPRPAP